MMKRNESMYDYDKINKQMDEKMKDNNEAPRKEEKYLGSLLFLLHLCLMSGMVWLGVMLRAPEVWSVIFGFAFIFAVSIMVHKSGSAGKAILLTLGSVFLGIFLLVVSCFASLSHMH